MIRQTMKSILYYIISPVRNEAKNIELTLSSVVKQTVKPIEWIIADDGSTDGTIEIVERYSKENPWIVLIQLPDRGYYDLITGGEVKAFYRGFERIKDKKWDFVAKLDGDISFEETYFERLFKEFANNNKLGLASGACFNWVQGKLIMEKSYEQHVRGAARCYKKECWDAIGGVISGLGWDAIDVYKARMLGWETRSFSAIPMVHHVKTWTKGGIIHGRRRSGKLCYLMGMHPFFFCLKMVKSLFAWPYIISAFAFGYGYFMPYIKNEKRPIDKELKRFIRKEQIQRILQKPKAFEK
jgi:poly-beta-1,6-N-acetyl-D-glucosamine synthase